MFIPAPRSTRYGTLVGGFAFVGLWVAALCGLYGSPAERPIVVLVVSPLLVVGVLLIARSTRLGVLCESSAFVVHGFFWNRTIPFHLIRHMPGPDSIGLLPFIMWTTKRDRPRATFLAAFWTSYPMVIFDRAYVERSLARLDGWRRDKLRRAGKANDPT